MADQPNAPSTTSAETVKPPAGAGGQAPPPEPGGRTFSQADIDRIVGERVAEEQRKAAQRQQEALLVEQGKFKELYEAAEQRAAAAETAAAQATRAALATRLGAAAGLPPELSARLHGTTEDELRADAQQLAALLPKAAGALPAPGTATNGARPPAGDAASARPTWKDIRERPWGAILSPPQSGE